MNTTLLVRKDQIAQARIRVQDERPLADGQVRVATGLLALTANNVTYAAFGDAMDYWKFFPSGEDGWGVLPAWGFGRVVQSLHPGVAVGEQLYGYWPLASSAVLAPERLAAEGFRDASPHRAGLHAIYNQYLRTNADAMHAPGREAAEAVLRPLFTTSWLIDDLMGEQDGFGARRLLLSSASSKTAYGTAFLLARRAGFEVVGLTSAAHRAFCEGLGCYTRVLAYEELASIPQHEPCVYIDFAGNAGLRRTVHERFGDRLRYSCAVGGAHVGQLGGGGGLPGPRPTLFFAPAQAGKRRQEWGGAVLRERIARDWQAFLDRALGADAPWLQVREHLGSAAIEQLYAQLVDGRADPHDGHVVRWR
jgi:hypothetical protein